MTYTVRLGHLPDVVAGDDAADALWVRVDQALAPTARIAFDHRQIITDALRVAQPPVSPQTLDGQEC